MNKAKMEKLHRKVCRGGEIPYELYDDYKEYVESIAPPMSAFKPVAHGRASDPLGSGLLNELSKPAGITYKSGKGAGA